MSPHCWCLTGLQHLAAGESRMLASPMLLQSPPAGRREAKLGLALALDSGLLHPHHPRLPSVPPPPGPAQAWALDSLRSTNCHCDSITRPHSSATTSCASLLLPMPAPPVMTTSLRAASAPVSCATSASRPSSLLRRSKDFSTTCGQTVGTEGCTHPRQGCSSARGERPGLWTQQMHAGLPSDLPRLHAVLQELHKEEVGR